MLQQRWIRYGAWAGIAFAVVAVASGAITGSPPGPDDADQVFKDFFVDKRDQLLVQAWMYALAAPLLLWFAAAVRRVLNEVEDGSYLGDLFLASVTATAALLIAAMAMHLEEKLEAIGVKRVQIEGAGGSDWVLIDAGDIVVHLFKPEARTLYGLEKMWGPDLDDPAPDPEPAEPA